MAPAAALATALLAGDARGLLHDALRTALRGLGGLGSRRSSGDRARGGQRAPRRRTLGLGRSVVLPLEPVADVNRDVLRRGAGPEQLPDPHLGKRLHVL